MKQLLIEGGHIIDPGMDIDETGNLFLADGHISRIHKNNLPPGTYDILDARGMIVCPGFIDMHCHLRQPGFEEKETIFSGSRAAVKGGFTTICCMPNTNPPLDNQSAIDYVKEIASSEAVNRVLPIGCVTDGRQGKILAELDEMAHAGVVGFSDDGSPVKDSLIMLKALNYSRTSGLPIIDHCEDTSLTGSSLMKGSSLFTESELAAIPDTAEQIILARDLLLARLSGGWVHIAHVSSEGSVELIRCAKERGISVTAEVTPHHLTLTEEIANSGDSNARVNPPLRTKRDNEALIKGLKENVIDIIATDHAPHTENDKSVAFSQAPCGISGLETALGSLLGLVHRGAIPLKSLIASLTCKPGRIIGNRYGKLGTLADGAPADITIFDPDKKWVVDTASFFSRGKNTPLKSKKLKGKVMATVYGGRVVYMDSAVTLKKTSISEQDNKS
ncbi:MAG: dihydroorotase [Dehalococcoidales bacterium]